MFIPLLEWKCYTSRGLDYLIHYCIPSTYNESITELVEWQLNERIIYDTTEFQKNLDMALACSKLI